MKNLIIILFVILGGVLFSEDLYYISGQYHYKVFIISTDTKMVEYSEYEGEELTYITESRFMFVANSTYRCKINNEIITFTLSKDFRVCVLKYGYDDVVMNRIAIPE